MKQALDALPRALRTWLPLAALAVCAALMVYGAVQQNFRSSANDPQIQIAEDVVRSLEEGIPPQTIVGKDARLDLSVTLSPFLIIYDNAGIPLASSVELHSAVPTLPGGVYDYTSAHGEDRITWQPERGLRFATVMKRYEAAGSSSTAGFVLVGRSLREVESRTSRLMTNLLLGLLVTLIVTFVTVLVAAL
jgi:hypothetical protein